jgi:SAM-dependent methyltransferase
MDMPEDNRYSPFWFAAFLQTIPREQTAAECDFLARQLAQPAFTSVLDVCCGMGRHAIPLAARGYRVVGVDVDAAALAVARGDAGDRVSFLQADMRQLGELPTDVDAVLLLWQSFGQFDDATNAAVLRQIRDRLRPGGRFVLDIYHRAFFATHLEVRRFARDGRTITETKRLDDNRLAVTLDYGPDLPPDVFTWRLFTPDEIVALARTVGLDRLLCCTGYDETQPASPESPRMQVVFARS